MALRWDYRPLFPNAPRDSERALWTRRSLISWVAAGALVIWAGTWTDEFWQYLVIMAAVLLGFDAGDMRYSFTDDKPEKNADGTRVTPHDRFYRNRNR